MSVQTLKPFPDVEVAGSALSSELQALLDEVVVEQHVHQPDMFSIRLRDHNRQVLSQAGRLDVLVNNAGYTLMGAAEETSVAEAKAQFETNFFGVVRMVNAVLPVMRKAGAGKIVNIGSLAGITAIPFGGFYTASKFAIEGYSEALWHELRPLGISVSVIEPGFVHTAIGDATQVAESPLQAYDPVRTRATSALGRQVKGGIPPEAVAKTVLRAIESRTPSLRYRVGTDAAWFPRLKQVMPWPLFAVGVRRTFDV